MFAFASFFAAFLVLCANVIDHVAHVRAIAVTPYSHAGVFGIVITTRNVYDAVFTHCRIVRVYLSRHVVALFGTCVRAVCNETGPRVWKCRAICTPFAICKCAFDVKETRQLGRITRRNCLKRKVADDALHLLDECALVHQIAIYKSRVHSICTIKTYSHDVALDWYYVYTQIMGTKTMIVGWSDMVQKCLKARCIH